LNLLIYYGFADKARGGVGIVPSSVVVKQVRNSFITHKVNKPSFFDGISYYALLPSFCLEIDGASAYTLNAHSKPDSNTTIFVSKLKVDAKKQSFEFDSFTKLKYPAFAAKSKTDYLFVGGKLIAPFYFFNYENLVGNIETGKYMPLNDLTLTNNYEELLKKFNFEYYLLDAIKLSPQKYRYLVLYKERYLVYDFDGEKSTLFKELALPNQKNFISQIIFSDTNKLLTITTDNELLDITF